MDLSGRGMLDALPMALVATADNSVVFLNRRMSQALGVEGPDWVGRPLADFAALVAERLGDAAFSARLASHRNPECPMSVELEWRTADKVCQMREESAPLRDAGGNIRGRILAYTDISREKAIDRMKSEFIAIASHELRTPMTSIKGSIDLILSGAAGDVSNDGQELLEIAQKGCERLIRLINDILDLAKIEAGRIKLRLARMDVAEAAEHAVSSLRSLAAMSNVALRVDRAESLPLVEADRDRIEQVLTNLLSNAIKYAPPQSEAVVELSAAEGWVQCAVVDRGCGIPESELSRVFDRFHQVVDARRKSGTGLGLAIAQALVHEHKGEIWVESKVNEGARFIFRLPVPP